MQYWVRKIGIIKSELFAMTQFFYYCTMTRLNLSRTFLHGSPPPNPIMWLTLCVCEAKPTWKGLPPFHSHVYATVCPVHESKIFKINSCQSTIHTFLQAFHSFAIIAIQNVADFPEIICGISNFLNQYYF